MKPAVLCVHQIGKVGSTSVVSALQQGFPNRKVYQTHALSEAGVLKGMAWWLERPDSPRGKFPDHLAGSIELRERFGADFSSARWFIFCLVRDPLLRDISAFFQNLHVYWIYQIPEGMRSICRQVLDRRSSGTGISNKDFQALIDDLVTLFFEKFPVNMFDQWFDREMQDVFGIDVFSHPFSIEQGYERYEHGTANVLLVRLEDLARVFVPATQAWLSGSDLEAEAAAPLAFERERSNDGGTKAYAELYRKFLEKVNAHAQIGARAGDSKVAQHFYLKQRIAA